jgi:guanylate kinase
MSGRLFVISGPSGAGKSTLIKTLRERVRHLGYSISHTTRRPRGAETDGVHYYFIDRETFQKMITGGAFVEWAGVYGELYGTSFSSLDNQLASGMDVLLDVDVQGAGNIRKHYDASVLIHLLPPSLEVLEKRLKDRGTDDAAVIGKRMEKARKEIANCVWYDFIIINDDLDRAVDEAHAVILSDRCRASRRMETVMRRFPHVFPGDK